jgi:hypothetical protein
MLRKNAVMPNAHGLIEKLKRRFLSHEIMNATNIIYPEFWV